MRAKSKCKTDKDTSNTETQQRPGDIRRLPDYEKDETKKTKQVIAPLRELASKSDR